MARRDDGRGRLGSDDGLGDGCRLGGGELREGDRLDGGGGLGDGRDESVSFEGAKTGPGADADGLSGPEVHSSIHPFPCMVPSEKK